MFLTINIKRLLCIVAKTYRICILWYVCVIKDIIEPRLYNVFGELLQSSEFFGFRSENITIYLYDNEISQIIIFHLTKYSTLSIQHSPYQKAWLIFFQCHLRKFFKDITFKKLDNGVLTYFCFKIHIFFKFLSLVGESSYMKEVKALYVWPNEALRLILL